MKDKYHFVPDGITVIVTYKSGKRRKKLSDTNAVKFNLSDNQEITPEEWARIKAEILSQ